MIYITQCIGDGHHPLFQENSAGTMHLDPPGRDPRGSQMGATWPREEVRAAASTEDMGGVSINGGTPNCSTPIVRNG